MTRDWNKDMTFLESAHATVIPFGFDETCHALSTALLTSSSGDVYRDTSRLIELSLVTEGSDMVLETYTRLMPVGFKLTSEIDARGNKFLKVFDKVDEGDVSNSMVMFERMLLDERQTICL
ncbi:hypothetical protein PC112_g16223 [Phytophthora cactorum]|nr:hypothetical protein PC112_g16223 [Phytophthora cactorum]